MYLYINVNVVTAATPHPPEKTRPAAVRNTTIPTGTRIGLNTTSTGVAMIRAITVPVNVNPDRTKRVVPAAPAVKNLPVRRREDGWAADWSWSWSFRVTCLD
ncbi:unnamed protein product [Prunus armeniaca]|uniref:Uncharacterized protein n=1 Tax=Prunus armeniaca TaxID=36596 RepID=A0A6J5W5W7_PRUAR|nr:unnamed protein product [Prunus armeniaca]